jgi:N-acylneuraminate cytidylyltransferase
VKSIQESFILGVIPARGGSKGLPRKNIRPLAGRPLIAYTIEAAQKSRHLTYTVVSTEDAEIARVARDCGAEAPFVRPAELARDDTPIFPVLRHATQEVEAQKKVRADLVLLLQPTTPFRTGEDIDACIERFFELDAEVVMTAKASEASPYYNLIEMIPDTPWVRLCKPPEKVLNRRQEAPKAWTVHSGVYVYSREALYSYEHHLRMKRAAVYEMPDVRILDIDSEQDLMFAEWLMERGAIR